LQQGIAPPGYPLLTGFVDIGKTLLHWCVMAWSKAGSGSIIDYGVADVWPKNRDNQQAVEVAILQALFGMRDQLLSADYCHPDGEIIPMQCVLVDSGNWEKPVYEFVRATGEKIFRVSKGRGDERPGHRSVFHTPDKQTAEKRVGDHCVMTFQETSGVWLTTMDTDYWKTWLHERFMTPDNSPQGCLTLFGSDKRRHVAFAHHICSEIEVEEFVEGKGLKRYWKKISGNNHWLDCAYGACVAASLHGMKLLSTPQEMGRKRFAMGQKSLGRQQFMSRPGGWVRGMR
jgi:phage terminase large subunit GpA-like protein